MPQRLFANVMLLLASSALCACASRPPLPVAVPCPRFPEMPPELLEPRATPQNVSDELMSALQEWLQAASEMATATSSPAAGTESSAPRTRH